MPDLDPSLRADLWWGWVCAAGGLLMGVAWRVLAAVVDERSTPAEVPAGIDSVLALTGLVLGLLVAAAVTRRPGAVPPRRLVFAVGGLTVAGALAWGTGRVLGVPPLGAVGAAFVAPAVAAGAVFVITFVQYLRSSPGQSAPGHSSGAGPGELHEVQR